MFQNLLVFISPVAVCFIVHTAAVEIIKDPNMQEGKSSYFECVVDTGVTDGVTFFIKPAINKGGCLGPGTGCSSAVPGYQVSQNSTATYLTIDSVDCTRETGDWYCRHDVTESTTSVLVNCGTIPSADGSLKHNGLELDVIGSNEEQQKLKVVISCANPSPLITWKYKSKNQPSFETIPKSAISSESTPTYSGSTCDSGRNFTISTMTASADDEAFCGEEEVYFSVTYYSLTVESSTPVSFKGLNCLPLLIVGIILLVVGIVITGIFVECQHPKKTIIVRDLKNKEAVEERFESYLSKHYDDVGQKSDAENGENGEKVWPIKGGKAHLSFSLPEGKVIGTFKMKFKQGDLSIVLHPKNTIIVPDLKHRGEVEGIYERYLKEHYDDVGQKSDGENGEKVWPIRGGEAHLSFNLPEGKVIGTFEMKFKQDDLSIVPHPKNTIIVPNLKDQEVVEGRFESYLKEHYDDVGQKSDAENGDKVWTIKGGEAHLSFNLTEGKVNETVEIKLKQGNTSNGQHPKKTIIVQDLKNKEAVEKRFESYLSEHYDDVGQKSVAVNGERVWPIMGGEAHLSSNSQEGKVIETFKFKQGDPSIGQHPKNTIIVRDLKNQEEVEGRFESYLKEHYDDVGQKSVAENREKVWPIRGGEARLSSNSQEGEVNGKVNETFEIKFKQGDPSIAGKLRLANFIYSIIHSAAGIIMMIIIAGLACRTWVGLCIGALMVSILNILYGICNIAITLLWENNSHGWLRLDFVG